MKDLADFSELDGSLPCVLCKAESRKTLVGNHWKCSACDHIFNEDGSATDVMCPCEKCQKKYVKEHEKKHKEFLKKIKKAIKKAEEKTTE